MYKILQEAKVGSRQTMASDSEILDFWMEHFSNLLNHQSPSSEDSWIKTHLTDECPVDEDAANNPIMEAEVYTGL